MVYVRVVLIILLSFVGVQSFADDWTYKAHPTFTNPQILATVFMGEELRSLGFEPLSRTSGGNIPLVGVDQIFYGSNEAAIFYKQGLVPSDTSLKGKTVPLGKGYVFHSESNGVPFALFFYRMNEKSANVVISKLKSKSVSFNSKIKFLEALIVKSYAAEPCGPNSEKLSDTEILLETTKKTLLQCATSALSSLKGRVDDMKNTLKSLGSYLQDPKKLWDSAVSQYKEIEGFVTQFQSVMKANINLVKNINPAVLVPVVCSMVTSALLDFVAKGKGWVGVGLSVALSFKKLAQVTKLMEVLSRAARKTGQVAKWGEEAIACLL